MEVGIPKTVESKDSDHTANEVFNSTGFDIGEDRKRHITGQQNQIALSLSFLEEKIVSI